MVVRKKNQEYEIKKFIEKGGSISESRKEMEWKNILIRIPKNMLHDIEQLLKEKIGISRTGWILQTLQEKLKEYKNE